MISTPIIHGSHPRSSDYSIAKEHSIRLRVSKNNHNRFRDCRREAIFKKLSIGLSQTVAIRNRRLRPLYPPQLKAPQPVVPMAGQPTSGG